MKECQGCLTVQFSFRSGTGPFSHGHHSIENKTKGLGSPDVAHHSIILVPVKSNKFSTMHGLANGCWEVIVVWLK